MQFYLATVGKISAAAQCKNIHFRTEFGWPLRVGMLSFYSPIDIITSNDSSFGV
jgi:hypothetical protein